MEEIMNIKIRPSKDELQKLVETTPIIKIGEMFDVTDNAVRKWMKKYGIEKMYGIGYWAKKNQSKEIPDKSYLEELINNNSLNEISKILGTSKKTIRKWYKKLGVPFPTMSYRIKQSWEKGRKHSVKKDDNSKNFLKSDKLKKSKLGITRKEWARIQHDISINNYYSKPKICKQCGEIIKVKDKVRKIIRKNFCSDYCRDDFYSRTKTYSRKSTSLCIDCGNIIQLKKRNISGFIKKKYCDECRIERFKRHISEIENKTKGELFKNRKNWQSARSCIRSHAFKVFFYDNKKEYKCEYCKYSLYIEVCHKKSVSEFSDDAKIKEINDIGNLIGLCPNHHWEYDNGHLILQD
jgi:hypothetical protein